MQFVFLRLWANVNSSDKGRQYFQISNRQHPRPRYFPIAVFTTLYTRRPWTVCPRVSWSVLWRFVVGFMAFRGRFYGGVCCNVLLFNALQAYFFLNIFQYISMDIEIGVFLLRTPLFSISRYG